MTKKIKLPTDINKRAKSIVDLVTQEEIIKETIDDEIKAAAARWNKNL